MRWKLLINIIATYFVGPFFSKVVNCSIKPKYSAFQFGSSSVVKMQKEVGSSSVVQVGTNAEYVC